MADIFVDNFSYALGDRRMSVQESYAAGLTVSESEDLIKCGFRQHFVCGPAVSSYDLAKEAVRPISGCLNAVGAIVYSTCIPANSSIGSADDFQQTGDVRHLMDYAACHLQAEFGLAQAQVIGLSQQACTGMIGTVRMGQMLINSDNEVDQVLCLTADRFPNGARYEQAYNLMSDGAAACTVSRQYGAYRIVSSHAITNGAMADASDDEAIGSFFTYSYNVITAALKKASLAIADIDWLAAQNLNGKAWQVLARLLKFDYAKIFHETLPEIGHMVSGDNMANLMRMEEQALVKPGQHVLLLMAGFGLNWQCLILQRTDAVFSKASAKE